MCYLEEVKYFIVVRVMIVFYLFFWCRCGNAFVHKD